MIQQGHFMYNSEKAHELVNERYEKLREDYPRTVHAAYHYILTMLSLHAPGKVPCFKGECAVNHIELDNLLFAFFMMCGLLEQELEGNPNINPMIKEVMCRKYLKLPPLVIEGHASS